ncbi:hypothetical protein BT69DRAFT_198923 [Atractiella rhizophila]|nr:hypothetical protein BT69DRAFT_198923 [Atractiella rhizophila]
MCPVERILSSSAPSVVWVVGLFFVSAVQLAGRPATQVLYSPADRFGLLGLLAIIRNADADGAMLSLGKELNGMGLDMASSGSIHPSFVTPWMDADPSSIEPEFSLPACYNVQPPPAQQKIGVFSDETLFYIFYSQPRDAMQELAAQELFVFSCPFDFRSSQMMRMGGMDRYKHNWRYHKELQMWLTKEQGTEPTIKTSQYERGAYIFFDPTCWEKVKRDFMLVYSCLATLRPEQ